MRPVLSGKADVALRLLRLFASHSRRHKGSGVVTALCTTTNSVPHAAQRLIRAGWVASTACTSRGYQLVTDRNELDLLDVTETVEGRLEDGRCVLHAQACPRAEPPGTARTVECGPHDAARGVAFNPDRRPRRGDPPRIGP